MKLLLLALIRLRNRYLAANRPVEAELLANIYNEIQQVIAEYEQHKRNIERGGGNAT